jgi:hypothetical protein
LADLVFCTFSIGHIDHFTSVEIDAPFVDISVAFEDVLLAVHQLMIEKEQRNVVRPHAGRDSHRVTLINQLRRNFYEIFTLQPIIIAIKRKYILAYISQFAICQHLLRYETNNMFHKLMK